MAAGVILFSVHVYTLWPRTLVARTLDACTLLAGRYHRSRLCDVVVCSRKYLHTYTNQTAATTSGKRVATTYASHTRQETRRILCLKPQTMGRHSAQYYIRSLRRGAFARACAEKWKPYGCLMAQRVLVQCDKTTHTHSAYHHTRRHTHKTRRSPWSPRSKQQRHTAQMMGLCGAWPWSVDASARVL